MPFDNLPIPDKLLSQRSAGILPLSTLRIHPKRAAWVLYVDTTFIDYDGNAFNATHHDGRRTQKQ
jgi:exosome complex RNA-binding protein Rrp42 (RNase PH superfamily)